MPTITEERIFLNIVYGSQYFLRQGDIVSAYLNARTAEEIYFGLPQGHPKYEDKTLVYKSTAAIYGLPEAGKLWYLHYSKFLKSIGFQESKNCPGLFWRGEGDNRIWILLYVDDFLYTSLIEENLDELEKEILKEFDAKFSKEVNKFVGIQFKENGEELKIHQSDMIKSLALKYELDLSPRIKTPMIENCKWTEYSTKLDNIRTQQVLVGELMYINMSSRPDISYSVNRIARSNSKATKETYRAAKRVLQYLLNTSDKGTTYKKWNNKSEVKLEIYSDSSFADIVSDGYKSTGGYIILLNGSVVGWKSYKIKWA